MKIDTFKVERWMNDFEDRAVYNLGETCIDSLSLEELLKLCGKKPEEYFAELAETKLAYSHIFGSPELFSVWESEAGECRAHSWSGGSE